MMEKNKKEHVSELTPEEFQKTFPIELRDVTPKFKDWYEEEKEKILNVIDKNDVIRINHIGSSAIPNIKAKPVVDILLEIDDSCNVDELISSLKSIDFGIEVLMRKEDPFELLMAKGMTVNGFDEKVFLLHVRYAGDWNELYFRDYLLEFPDVAREYGALKEKILDDISEGKMERMPNGKPNGYSMAKFDFVNDISCKAKERYGNRYCVSD